MPDLPSVPEKIPIKVDISGGKLAPDLLDGQTRRQWVDRLKAALGTDSDDLAWYALLTMFRACKVPETLKLNAMLEQIRVGKPRDPQELLLLVEMAACAQRMQDALIAETDASAVEDKLAQAKLAKLYGQLYARQYEALRRCKPKSTSQQQCWVQGKLL